MSQLKYSNDPFRGQILSDNSHCSQAVRLPGNPSLIKTSGQGGWDQYTGEYPPTNTPEGLAKQVDQAFANVDLNLRTAGSKNGWGDVYLVRVYVLGTHDEGLVTGLAAALRKWCPTHCPLLTAVEVKGLAFEEMRIEVEVEAWDEQGGK
jgi:enamine deaminase RidA (YjgF/YER057c/UK114 family)